MWVLVHWTETNQTSILDDSMVPDKTMLQDSTKIGMVEYGDPNKKTPKNGWKAYSASVLAVHSKKSALAAKETEYLGRKDKEVRLRDQDDDNSSSDSDAEIHSVKRQKKELQKHKKDGAKKAQEKLMEAKQNMASVVSSDSSDDEDLDRPQLIKKVRHLEASVAQLKERSEKLLSLNFKLQEGLYKQLRDAVVDAVNHNSTVQQNTQCADSSRKPICPTAESSGNRARQMSSSSNSDNDTLDSFLSQGTILQLLRSPNAFRLTCSTMTSMFTTSELATGLVTGQRLKQEDKDRPVLDQNKINAIVEFVCKEHSGVSAAAVRTRMSQKCKDTRHSMKRMEKSSLNVQL